jgi:D-glycero-D-manno-heptose 1,7-bisphosphate phosphatase
MSFPHAVFLDRDGTVNKKPPNGRYVSSPDEVRLLPRVGQAVRRLNDAGILVLVASNQRGVALGRMTLHDVEEVNCEVSRRLERWGAHLDGFFICPHGIGSCDCRKPSPGLLLQAQGGYPGLDLSRCVMIGDSETDVLAGMAVGMVTVRLAPPRSRSAASAVRSTLAGAVDALLDDDQLARASVSTPRGAGRPTPEYARGS